MIKDALGDRLKAYEAAETERRLMPLLPALARVDGRAFHTFTRGMDRPFDYVFMSCMQGTALDLVKETGACAAYVQSDEITLAWHSTTHKSQIWFDGRIAKMTSQLGALATLFFYERISAVMPDFAKRRPTFDARVWNVPNRTEAANAFVWREQDAVRNSLNAVAHVHYSQKELSGKSSSQRHDMLHAKGVNWNDLPDVCKRGAYILVRRMLTPFSAEEIEKLPPKHAARKDPNLQVERVNYGLGTFPAITTVVNREAVLFEGAHPLTAQDLEGSTHVRRD